MMIKTATRLAIVFGVCSGSAAWAGHLNEILEAELDGREEVGEDPTQRLVGDPDGKGEAYVFGIDGDPTTLCYVLTVEKIELVLVGEGMMAHIHEGLRDSNGPVVAALAGPEDGNAGDCLTEGEAGKFPTEEAGIVQRILNNPENFYINVHNPSFPDGAIRGQLKNQLHDHVHNDDTDGDGGTSAGTPTVPVNLTSAVYSSTALEIFWDRSTDSDGLVVAYQVLRDGELVTSVPGNSFYDEGLVHGTTYSYSIAAIDNMANESAPSTTIEVTTGD